MHRTLIIAFCLLAFAAGEVLSQTWDVLETHSEVTGRQENGFMSCKGKFYLLGGYGIRETDIYDPNEDLWTKGAAPPVEMHHFQAVRHGDKIFVLGALTGSFPFERPLEHMYIYHTSEDRWEKGTRLPQGRERGASGVAVYRGMIYLVGGSTGAGRGESTAWVDRYDPRTGKWKKLPDAPHPRQNFHVSIIDGQIYAAGGKYALPGEGQSSSQTLAMVDVFRIDGHKWTSLPEAQNLPTQRSGCTSVAIMDHLLIIGGESADHQTCYSVVEAYDVESGQWEKWGDLKEGRYGTQAFMCVGTVFISSGSGPKENGMALASTEILHF